MSGMRQMMESSGLCPREIVQDGRIHRCDTESKPGRRNGWYVVRADGSAVWGDWVVGGVLGRWQGEHGETADPRPEILERLRANRERERAHRARSIRSAREYWRESRPLNRLHPYLERKGLSPMGCAGLRSNDGLLIVPVMLNGWLISVQAIYPDGTKRFWTGAPVKGGSFSLSRERAAVTVFVEGLATGLAVYQSVRHSTVVVCFDAGNLLPVVSRLNPSGSVCIAGDNDWKTLAKIGVNPGIEKARNAAELIGCGVAWPHGIEGSDWCDWLAEVGARAARSMEHQILAACRYVVPASAVP